MGDVVFSLAGFAVGAGGSVYWDPTQVVPAVNDGTPLLSVVSIVGSSWAGDTLTVLAPTGSISVVAGSDFSASGATPVILNSIASALRNKNVVSSQLIAGTWTLGAGWSGNFSGGFTFAPGVVTTLTNTTTYAPGTYTISWTVSGRTAGSFNLSVGGFTLYAIASSGTANIRFSANTPITITPTTDFNGTIIPSIISYYTFNQGAWCRVINNTLEIRSWAYGTVANNYVSTSQYAVSKTGSNLAVTAFTGATDAVVTTGRSWPVTGYAPWFSTEIPDPRSVSFVARLDYGDGVGAIGEIVAMALISQSPLAAEVGRFYPYARVRLPLHVKHDREILVRRLMFAS
jgi:hypothetical protein